ncbi:MAG: N-acetyltransferase [Gemmatimonadetes bacterium]|nr:N-acetyltransferase [Gemmatimonadota bacterium]
MDPASLIRVEHLENEHRFVARVGGAVAYLAYRPVGDGVLDYASTFTPPELRERHVASTIVRHALDYARNRGFKVIPTCWFVAGFVERHAEYAELIEQGDRGRQEATRDDSG